MKILLISVGKNNESYIKEGLEDFTKRISKYYPVEWLIVAPQKNAASISENELKKKKANQFCIC